MRGKCLLTVYHTEKWKKINICASIETHLKLPDIHCIICCAICQTVFEFFSPEQVIIKIFIGDCMGFLLVIMQWLFICGGFLFIESDTA